MIKIILLCLSNLDMISAFICKLLTAPFILKYNYLLVNICQERHYKVF
ncbi:hypothetical protein OnM2_c9366o5 [Erysiphe neolycopersici]|uniref:Uncharacterized protein n=1 Tax=Erysiphe neolycopersici TaxID=212602 RepID=A0A420H8H8_9PEZI|nr:hypothetical protein OnM2_c9366o5 [Erysiphe neolycopersici]